MLQVGPEQVTLTIIRKSVDCILYMQVHLGYYFKKC